MIHLLLPCSQDKDGWKQHAPDEGDETHIFLKLSFLSASCRFSVLLKKWQEKMNGSWNLPSSTHQKICKHPDVFLSWNYKKDTKDHRWKSSQGCCDHHKWDIQSLSLEKHIQNVGTGYPCTNPKTWTNQKWKWQTERGITALNKSKQSPGIGILRNKNNAQGGWGGFEKDLSSQKSLQKH
jgi:hypothetical protein